MFGNVKVIKLQYGELAPSYKCDFQNKILLKPTFENANNLK